MRTLLAPLVLAVAGVFGVAASAAAHGPIHGHAPAPVYAAPGHHGDARVFVAFGDVAFVRGRPYHRHLNRPLLAFGPPHAVRYFYYAPAPVVVVPSRHHRGQHYRNDPRDHGRPGYPRYRDGYYR